MRSKDTGNGRRILAKVEALQVLKILQLMT